MGFMVSPCRVRIHRAPCLWRVRNECAPYVSCTFQQSLQFKIGHHAVGFRNLPLGGVVIVVDDIIANDEVIAGMKAKVAVSAREQFARRLHEDVWRTVSRTAEEQARNIADSLVEKLPLPVPSDE